MQRYIHILLAATAMILTSLCGMAQTNQSAVTASVSTAATTDNVATRLQGPTSSVTVSAPGQLVLRAAVPHVEAAPDEAPENEATTEVQEQADDKMPHNRGVKAPGYRVQVFADNNVRTAKAEARQRERQVAEDFPQWGTYVTYASPYWRLRVGDFRTQYDAEKAAAEIRKAFPAYAKEVRVVRDRISGH